MGNGPVVERAFGFTVHVRRSDGDEALFDIVDLCCSVKNEQNEIAL